MRLTKKMLVATAVAALLLAPVAAAIPSSGITKNYWTPTASAYGHLVCGQEDDPGGEAFGLFDSAPEDHGIGGACFDVSGHDGTVQLTVRDYADAPPTDQVDPQDVSEDYTWIIGGYYHLDDPDHVTEQDTPADPMLDRTNFDLVRHFDPEGPTEFFDEPEDWHPFCTTPHDIWSVPGTPVSIDVTDVDTLKVRVDTLYMSTVLCEHYHDAHNQPPGHHATQAVDRLSSGNPTGTPPTAGTITVAPSN